ncbi:MAG: transposase, partial [Lawsonibacter sp.]|nr:transposase [Lawsonibacter sp.]
MERLENRHNSDTQTAIFEETSDTLSIADMLKRTLERTITSGEDMTRSLGQTARNQKLPPATLIKFLIAAEGGSLAKELHRAGIDATPAAVSQRRRQIPPAVFRKVFRDFTTFSAYGQPNRGYKGYRVLACDGTAVNMARNPNVPSFVCNNSAPKGYNQLHLSPLFDIYDRTYFDAVIQPAPHKDEPGALVEMVKRNDFNRRTIIVLDRGYESYNVMAHLMNTPNVYFVLRVKHNHSAMREIARLPMLKLDCDIVDDLKEIYHRRWGIETSFRDLKYSAGLVNLHG